MRGNDDLSGKEISANIVTHTTYAESRIEYVYARVVYSLEMGQGVGGWEETVGDYFFPAPSTQTRATYTHYTQNSTFNQDKL